jgi:hypothetical protein
LLPRAIRERQNRHEGFEPRESQSAQPSGARRAEPSRHRVQIPADASLSSRCPVVLLLLNGETKMCVNGPKAGRFSRPLRRTAIRKRDRVLTSIFKKFRASRPITLDKGGKP